MTEALVEHPPYAEVTSRYLALKAAVPTRAKQHDLAKKHEDKMQAAAVVAEFDQFLALPGTLQAAGLRASSLAVSLFRNFDHEQYEELKILMFMLADIGTTALINGYMITGNRYEESLDQGIVRMGQALGNMKDAQRPVERSERARFEKELVYFQDLHDRLTALKDRLKNIAQTRDTTAVTEELTNASDEVRTGIIPEPTASKSQGRIMGNLWQQLKNLKLPF